jgi:hypothetical protein
MNELSQVAGGTWSYACPPRIPSQTNYVLTQNVFTSYSGRPV